MSEKRWLYFALGVTTVISAGAVTNQLVPLTSTTGLGLSDAGITFPDGTVQTTAAQSDSRRKFYLTTTEYQGGPGSGDSPLEACAAGFHMASLWELADLGDLSYDLENPSARTRDDSGEGPPVSEAVGGAAFRGWVRTGFGSSGALESGEGNCNAWTTTSEAAFGTRVFLPSDWRDPAFGGFFPLVWGTPWAGGLLSCTDSSSVWCVEDYAGAGG